jgi:hypothetical protein
MRLEISEPADRDRSHRDVNTFDNFAPLPTMPATSGG